MNTSCFKSILKGESHPLLKTLKLMPMDILKQLESIGRLLCPSCLRRRSIYCYTCAQFMTNEGQNLEIPRMNLPFHVDIIKHVSELDSKSTALHAKLLAPDRVTLYSYPDELNSFEKAFNDETSLLLFPSDRSISIEEVNWSKIERLIVLDGTWNQVHGMTLHPYLQKVSYVRIEHAETLFWRSNGRGRSDRPNLLATIEAIYHFFRQHATTTKGSYEGQYDNLLFLFVHTYNKVRQNMSSRFEKKKFL